MSIFDIFRNRGKPKAEPGQEKRSLLFSITPDGLDCPAGYTVLADVPEVVAAARKIAELIGSATIHLMSNEKAGDVRIINELSRLVDIEPSPNMTRAVWMEGIVMNMLLYGKGNAIVQPHTHEGYIQSLESISASRVSFDPIGYRDYKVLIDGKPKKPGNVLHFVYNPDKFYLWKGQGVTVPLKEVLDNLVQARHTENAFLSSEYKPNVVVRVDANVQALSTVDGRQAIIDQYLKPSRQGEPWLIPGEMMDVSQIKPLSLADLAIADGMTVNKKTIAAIFGVPAWVVGAGEYDRAEWNTFIQTKIMSLAKGIAAELTRKILVSPKWYFRFNVWSLMDYDLKTVSDILLDGSDRGFANGDEWRDRVNLSPAGLTDYRVLENYIPFDMSGKQKKLIQEGETE